MGRKKVESRNGLIRDSGKPKNAPGSFFMSPLGAHRRLEVSKTEDSDIAANNIEELIEQVLLQLNKPLDRVLFAH